MNWFPLLLSDKRIDEERNGKYVGSNWGNLLFVGGLGNKTVTGGFYDLILHARIFMLKDIFIRGYFS
jgi:hypothetical protein